MAFNTGLSGVNAANQDLKVTGNNIANASTTGFKLSRAEFGDAYTQSILGMGSTRPGAGVNVANIGQKFTQGNITQTGNALDLAIDGTGFFITEYEGSRTTFTRNGVFGVSDEGYLVNNQNARLQGFGITEQGTADGVQGDIRIEQGAQPPKATQRVDAGVNVPAGAEVLAEMGSLTRTNGLAIGQVQTGSPISTASLLSTIGPPQTVGTPASVLGAVNTADRYTGTDVVPTSYVYTTGTTPQINSAEAQAAPGTFDTELLGNNPADTTANNTADDIDIAINGEAAVTVGPLDSYTNDLDTLIDEFQDAIDDTTLQGSLFVRESSANPGQLELYTDDGATITSVAEGSGTLAADLGLDATTSQATKFIQNPEDTFEIEITDSDGDTSTESIGPIDSETDDLDELISDIQSAINNSELSGTVLVRESNANPGQLEFYTTDGTTIDSIDEDGGDVVSDLGFGTVATDQRLLLDDPTAALGDETIDIELEEIDGTGTQTISVDLSDTYGGETFDNSDQDNLIDFLQAAIDANYAGAGTFTVRATNGGIEISSDEDADYQITNIADDDDDLGSQLNITNGATNERVFQDIPDSSDTIQFQIRDPNVNNGTPTTVQLEPFPTGATFSSLSSLITAFQDSLDDHPILGGRVQVQEDPDQEGQLQFLSTTGTSIQNISDLGSSEIADRLNLNGGTVEDSIYSELPPSSPETIDISLQGPNINDGDATTVTIEPFPVDGDVDNLGQLLNSFQRAIDNNATLAGRIRVEESEDNPGRIRLVANGPFGSDGTAILNVTDNVGTIASTLGIDFDDTGTLAPTVTAPVAGSNLFDDGGNIDLTSIQGTPVRVQGNEETGLDFNNLELGSATTLTGSLNLSGSQGDGSGTLELIVQSGNVADSISVNVPGGGFSSPDDLADAINNRINASTLLSGELSVDLDSSNRLRFTNDDNDSSPIVVSDNGSTDTITADNLGLTSNSNPEPTLVLGEQNTAANNEIDIAVGGDNPGNGTIVIPAGEYEDAEAVVDVINNQIRSNVALFGKVEAEAVNGRIQFSLTELGGFPNTLSVEGTDAALEAIGHEVQSQPTPIDPVDRRNSFRINLTVPLPDEENRSGSVEISLDENIRSIEQLAQAINRELASVDEEDFIGVRAQVLTNADGEKQLEFEATQAGEASQISITDIRAPGEDIEEAEIAALLQVDRFNNEYLEEGVPAVTNGYPEQTFVLDDGEGNPRNVTIDAELSAAQIANQLSDLPGVRASATTSLTFRAEDYSNAGDMNLMINGQLIEANDFEEMIPEINQYQQSTLRGVTAEISDNGDLVLRSRSGADIQVQIEPGRTADRLTLIGAPNTAPITLGGTENAETTARVGGTVEVILNEGVTMTDPEPRVSGLFNGLSSDSFEDYTINDFDANDANTYNETASLTIYDSLGTPHQLQMFFVKDPDDPDRPQDLNSWTVYTQIDGQDVGDPDPNLPFPENQEPTQASFKMFFSPDGTLDEEASGDWLISNWLPQNEQGNPTGAYAPETEAEGGDLPLDRPNLTSNFEINFRNTTQYGGSFSRNDFQQDGYASGRLRDVQVDDEGNIFARYTNGEDQLLGQVAVANFRNPEGLESVGFTEWVATADSGDVTVSTAGTGVLGNIRSSSLEESNVDLSEQLVNLIVAQRNYQASAKTIETTNAVTQTIINLR